ncbi:MAG: hypothetical protein ACRENZ_02280 [Thermodesulfobacteriota bacterium]
MKINQEELIRLGTPRINHSIRNDKLYSEENENVIDLYNKDYRLKDIGKMLQIDPRKVSYIIDESGIKKRSETMKERITVLRNEITKLRTSNKKLTRKQIADKLGISLHSCRGIIDRYDIPVRSYKKSVLS